MATRPNKALLDRLGTTPVIIFDGEEWPVPKLTPKQNEKVVPTLLEVWPLIIAMKDSTDKMGHLAEVVKDGRLKGVYDCIFLALERGHPDLTREEFDTDFAIGVFEAFDALIVIAAQTGVIKMGNASKSPPPGEAAAPSSPTGE